MKQVDNFKILNFTRLVDVNFWSVQALIKGSFNYSDNFKLARIGDFITRNKNVIQIDDAIEYNRITVKINGNGVYLRDKKKGKQIGTKRQYLISEGQFILSKIDARNGAFGIIPEELDGAIVTNDFPTFYVNKEMIDSYFLFLITGTKEFRKICSKL